MTSGAVPPKSVVVGIMRVARGRADGIACFGGTSQSYLASLAPLVAFPLVSAAMRLLNNEPNQAGTGFAMTLCALLAPAVLSFELAKLWGRTDQWIRFATAFNWCEWTLPLFACLMMVPIGIAMAAGLDENAASVVLVLSLGAYGLWLHWFLARKALALSRLRATLMVFAVNIGTVAVVLGPHFLADSLQ
jgi:hypothetical protein